MDGFSGLKTYQTFRRRDWWEKGYILLNPLTGHKAYIYDWEKQKEIKASFTKEFWDKYKEIPRNPLTGKKAPRNAVEEEMCENVSWSARRKAESENQSINYPIQGTGALIYKFASIYFFNYLKKNNLIGKVKLCVPVHDEWNIEAPEEIAEETAQALYQCMVKAGAVFCTRCKLDADISRSNDGSLPTYWIH